MANIMDNGTEYVPAGWDTMSLQKKEIMATRSILAVTEELYEINDAEGLKVLAQNLQSLMGWVNTRTGLLNKKLDIIERTNSLLNHMNSKGIDEDFSEQLSDITSLTDTFLTDAENEEDETCPFSRAYVNLQQAMQAEVEKFEAEWQAEEDKKSA